MAFWDGKNKDDNGVKEGKKEDEVELKPADVKAQLDKIGTLETGLNEIKAKTGTLDRMAAYLDEQDAAKIRKQQEELANRNKQNQEQLEDEWLTNPQSAARKEMQPLVEATVNTTAKNMIRDIVESNPEKYGLYSDPEFKRQMENLIFQLPLNQRANPQAIENCFYVAKGQNEEAIKEGKMKSRFAAASGSSNGTGGESGGKGSETVTLTAEEKKAAKIFGMTDEDYAKSKKEYVYGI